MTPNRQWLYTAIVGIALVGAWAATPARADDPVPAVDPVPAANPAPSDSGADVTPATDAPAPDAPAADGLIHLVPALAANPYRLEPGVRPYLHRLSISPGFGALGSEKLFLLRVAYNPNAWLGYEGTIGHNPSHSVQAIVHRFSAIVRRPLSGRFQPYATAGYGMTIVLPGRSINADPVTKNALAYGGGLEFFVRSDLALRAEMLGMTVMGRQQYRQGLVAYDYREETIALAFYRTLGP